MSPKLEIAADEEIVFDYAMCLYKGENGIDYRFGSKNCRNFITNEDWQIPELQKKYDDFFSWYLQGKLIP